MIRLSLKWAATRARGSQGRQGALRNGPKENVSAAPSPEGRIDYAAGQIAKRHVLKIGRLLLLEIRQDAGAFRSGPVDLPGAPFAPPSSGDVPTLAQKLCELFPHSESAHPVLDAAWLHAQFTLIHPFSDGNGGEGRILQDWALMRKVPHNMG